jgi:hypothetical protein
MTKRLELVEKMKPQGLPAAAREAYKAAFAATGDRKIAKYQAALALDE